MGITTFNMCVKYFCNNFEVSIIKPFITFIIGITLIACGGDEDDRVPVDTGPSACGVTPSETIAEQEARNTADFLQRFSQDNEELIIRDSFDLIYQVGEFRIDGALAGTATVANDPSSPLPIEDYQFPSTFSTNSAESNSQSTFVTWAGVSVGASLANNRSASITFDSNFAVRDMELVQLPNPQSTIDLNQSSFPDSNQFVYGVIQGITETTISVVASCASLTAADVEAAQAFFEASADYEVDNSASVGGELVIRSKRPIPIAYFVRSIDPPLPIPFNLSAGVENGPTIVLNWPPVENIRDYRVFFSQSPDFDENSNNVQTINVPTNRFELLQGVELGESWFFRVGSVVGGNVGALSAPLGVTVPASPPEAALTLQANPQANGSIKLSWSIPEGNSANAYNIQRRLSPEENWIDLVQIEQSNALQAENFSEREYFDSAVEPLQTYEYRMTYANILSPPESPESNIVTITAIEPTDEPPTVPIAAAAEILPVQELSVVQLNAADSSHTGNQPLSYSWEAVDSNSFTVTIQNPNSVLATFTAPDINTPSTVLEFILTVSDGTLSDTDIVAVTVLNNVPIDPDNSPPVARIESTTLVVDEGDIITLDASDSSDPDGDNLTFTWRQSTNLDIPTGIIGQTDPIAIFNAPFDIEGESETFRFLVEVFDGALPDTETVEVTVNKRQGTGNGLLVSIDTQHGTLQPDELDLWNFRVTNTSDFERENILLEVFYPGHQMQSVSDSVLPNNGDCVGTCGSVENELITWQVGNLAAGQSKSFFFNPRAKETLENGDIITINARASDDFGSEISSSREIHVLEDRILELSLTNDKQPVLPGEDIEYTLTYGFSDASNQAEDVVLLLTYPSSFTFKSASDEGSVSLGEDTSHVSWTINRLQHGDTGNLRVKLTVPEDPLAGELFETTATIQDSNAQTAPSLAHNIVQISHARPITLSINSTHNPVEPNKSIEMYATLSNESDAAIEDVTFLLYFQSASFADLAEVSISGGAICTSSTCANEYIVWNIPVLGAGESIQFSLPPTVRDSATIGEGIDLITHLNFDGSSYLHKYTTLEITDALPMELGITSSQSPVTALDNIRYDLAYLFGDCFCPSGRR